MELKLAQNFVEDVFQNSLNVVYWAIFHQPVTWERLQAKNVPSTLLKNRMLDCRPNFALWFHSYGICFLSPCIRRRSQCTIKLCKSNHVEEWGTVVGGPRAGVVEGGGAWNDPVLCLQLLHLLCVSPIIETYLQEAGPAGMFPAGGISRINQANPLFLPPGEDRQPWAPVTVSTLCGSLAVGRSQQGFLEERTWNQEEGAKLRRNNAKFV